MLFAIGAGKQVVAVDDQSNYPPEAPKTDLSGFTPNVEAIAAKHPDLVVIANDTKGLVAGLEALHITTLLQPAASTLADSYHELRELGRVTGYGTEADAVIADMQAKIATIVDKYKVTKPRTVYHELDQTYFTATSKTFIGQAYSLLGLTNIGDAADSADAAGYPQLSAEAVVTANPDLIVLADTVCCQQTAQTVAARPAWSNISAVKHQAIVEANDDVASRWGPRFVDFLNQIALAVSKLPS
jgi:iron complex transport system substrate-binding protein